MTSKFQNQVNTSSEHYEKQIHYQQQSAMLGQKRAIHHRNNIANYH